MFSQWFVEQWFVGFRKGSWVYAVVHGHSNMQNNTVNNINMHHIHEISLFLMPHNRREINSTTEIPKCEYLFEINQHIVSLFIKGVRHVGYI